MSKIVIIADKVALMSQKEYEDIRTQLVKVEKEILNLEIQLYQKQKQQRLLQQQLDEIEERITKQILKV